MTEPEAPRYLAVGRLRKPHGLKGEFTVFPLTDDPAEVFRPGRRLVRLAIDGTVVGEPLEVERGKAYHREWLVKFRGMASRGELDSLRGQFLGVASDELPPPAMDEVYLHELEGYAVRGEDGTPIGLVSGMYELPAGLTLEVQGPKREFLLPFRKEFVRAVLRPERALVVALPEGMLDL